jgi:hypothetical protein
LVLPVNGSVMVVCNEIGQFELMMAPRTLVVFEY